MNKSNLQSIERWHLGLILQNARSRTGIAQAAAAKQLGYSNAFISQIERGHVSVPFQTIPKLVKLYSAGDQAEDSRLMLCIIRLTNIEQWAVWLPVLSSLLNRSPEALNKGVDKTVNLRLKECGIEV